MSFATQLKEQGQQAALFGAGSAADQIMDLFVDWCKPGHTFLIEDFRMYVERVRPEIFVTGKYWGSLPRAAIKRGLIRSTGRYLKTRSPATHAHPAAEWMAL